MQISLLLVMSLVIDVMIVMHNCSKDMVTLGIRDVFCTVKVF